MSSTSLPVAPSTPPPGAHALGDFLRHHPRLIQPSLAWAAQRRRLEEILEGFEVRAASVEDHRLAATIRDDCRQRGVAAAAIDCLISAQAIRANAHLFTLDRDFDRIATVSSLRLLREP